MSDDKWFLPGNLCSMCNEDHGEHVLLSQEEQDLFIEQGFAVTECSRDHTGAVYGVIRSQPKSPADVDFMREISS